jgi:hypothetical protein
MCNSCPPIPATRPTSNVGESGIKVCVCVSRRSGLAGTEHACRGLVDPRPAVRRHPAGDVQRPTHSRAFFPSPVLSEHASSWVAHPKTIGREWGRSPELPLPFRKPQPCLAEIENVRFEVRLVRGCHTLSNTKWLRNFWRTWLHVLDASPIVAQSVQLGAGRWMGDGFVRARSSDGCEVGFAAGAGGIAPN